MPKKKRDIVERFTEKFEKTESCRVWKSTVLQRGYGQFWVGGNKRSDLAHRVSYEIFTGPIPEGMQIDHLCRNTLCVNPHHLQAVPCRTNVLRGVGNAAVNFWKTHCTRGHAFIEHSYTDTKGRRVCRVCKAISARIYREKHPDRERHYCPIKRREKYLQTKLIHSQLPHT